MGSDPASGSVEHVARDERIEHDSLGDVAVPAGALWKAQTQRAVENFPISGRSIDPRVLRALALIKAAAAQTNAELGVLAGDVADAIARGAGAIAAGDHLDQFPIDVFQTGSGTSTNMNMNEVVSTLAAAAGVEAHPNDHVNASQSSNDVFPSAIRVAAAVALVDELQPALARLAVALRGAEERFADVVKSGRTHLMDAVPVTLGQEFGGYATAVENGSERVTACLPRLGALPLGGTAVGTGLNAPAGFAQGTIARLRAATGLEWLVEAPDHFEAQGMQDALVEVSGACRVVAVSLNKIATDLRLMSSGPTTGLAEIHLPDLQPGSSIMPGKVNPVLPEAVHQVVAQVIGNDAAIAFAGSMGVFELNTMLPVMARNLLESIQILANVSRLLAERCIDGIEADEEACLRYALSSPSLATALNPVIGYEAAAQIVKQAVRERRTIREVVLESGLLDAEAVDRVLDVRAMASTHRSPPRSD